MPERGRCFSVGQATLSGPVAVKEKRLETATTKFSKRAEGQVRLLRARGLKELRKLASGFATQDFWLRNGKVRSQVSGLDQSRFPWRKLGKEEEEEPATERRREYTDLGLDLGEREEQVVCHASALALVMTDEVRR